MSIPAETATRSADGSASRLCVAALVVVALVGLATSPLDGGYWWSDGPRHALNGAFILDLLRDRPLGDPVGYAYAYYMRYPALTILFYPPLLYVFLAGAFAAFGVSPLVAQAVVAAFHLLLLLGAYALARRWFRPAYALAVALLAGAGPELLVWSRQVMLDVPAYGCMVLAVVLFMRWLDGGRPLNLYLCNAALLAAVYIKFNTGLILLPFAVTFVVARGWRGLADRHIWFNAVLMAIALVPAAVMLMKFGGGNLDSIAGSQTTDLPRTSIRAWTFYLEAMPSQLGWPALLLVPVGAVLLLRARSIPAADRALLASWWVIGYLVFSYIALREFRHALIILVPPAAAAIFLLRHLEPRLGRLAPAAAIVLAAATTAWGLFGRPAPTVVGHAEAARVLVRSAKPGENILFSGYRDGSFVFAMRTLGASQRTVRADKFLLRMFIARERGVQDRGLDREAILALIRRHGIRHIVAEAEFWTDLPSMALLDEMLRDRSLFAEIARIPVTANMGRQTPHLSVLRFLGEVQDPPEPITLEMVGLGRSISEPGK